jgi:hypothetical protein
LSCAAWAEGLGESPALTTLLVNANATAVASIAPATFDRFIGWFSFRVRAKFEFADYAVCFETGLAVNSTIAKGTRSIYAIAARSEMIQIGISSKGDSYAG